MAEPGLRALRQQQIKAAARDLLQQCTAKKEEIRRVAEVIGNDPTRPAWDAPRTDAASHRPTRASPLARP